MNRSGLLLIGAAVAILGYALVYSGLSTLNPSITPNGQPMGIIDALMPTIAGKTSGASKGSARKPVGGGGQKGRNQ